MLTTLTGIFITVFLFAGAKTATLMNNSNMKKIVVVYSEKNVKIEGKEIILSYYDEKTLSRVTKNEKTNSSGTISFLIPGSNNGASSIFSIALSEKEINKTRAFRIPSESIYGARILYQYI